MARPLVLGRTARMWLERGRAGGPDTLVTLSAAGRERWPEGGADVLGRLAWRAYERRSAGWAAVFAARPRACPHCAGTGIKG